MSELKEIPELTALIKEHEPNAFDDDSGYIMGSFFAKDFMSKQVNHLKCVALYQRIYKHILKTFIGAVKVIY